MLLTFGSCNGNKPDDTGDSADIPELVELDNRCINKLEDIWGNESINHFYPADLDFWGSVNIVTMHLETDSHGPVAVFLADAEHNILYEFHGFLNNMPISDVLVADFNGDGLKDIQFTTQLAACISLEQPEYTVTFYQMENGLFYISEDGYVAKE